MGPFKQIKDGGLDTRKVAFECMYTLLENCLDRLDIFEFLHHVEDGLKDHYDIKVRKRLVFMKLEYTYMPFSTESVDVIISVDCEVVKVKANCSFRKYVSSFKSA